MSLHQQLRDLLDERIGAIEQLGEPDDGMARVVRAVVELHAPCERTSGLTDKTLWVECPACYAFGPTLWPCKTVRAIARELGIEEGDR